MLLCFSGIRSVSLLMSTSLDVVHSFFRHSPVKKDVCISSVGAITSRAIINICVQVLCERDLFYLSECLGGEQQSIHLTF